MAFLHTPSCHSKDPGHVDSCSFVTSFVCLPLNTWRLPYACFSAFLCIALLLFILLSPTLSFSSLLFYPHFITIFPFIFLHTRIPVHYFPSQADIIVLLGVPFSGGQNPSGCHTTRSFEGMYFRIWPRGGVCAISVASSLLNRQFGWVALLQ